MIPSAIAATGSVIILLTCCTTSPASDTACAPAPSEPKSIFSKPKFCVAFMMDCSVKNPAPSSPPPAAVYIALPKSKIALAFNANPITWAVDKLSPLSRVLLAPKTDKAADAPAGPPTTKPAVAAATYAGPLFFQRSSVSIGLPSSIMRSTEPIKPPESSSPNASSTTQLTAPFKKPPPPPLERP